MIALTSPTIVRSRRPSTEAKLIDIFEGRETEGHPATEPLGSSSLPLQTPTPIPSPGRHSYHRYVVRVPADLRSSVINALREEGIASEIYYRHGLHQQPALVRDHPDALADSMPLLETERATTEALALPLYPELTLDSIERVVGCVTRILKG